MKKPLLILVLCMLCLVNAARATHIFAADLLYTHVTGNTYRVTLVLYGDCGASVTLLNDLYIGDPNILVQNGPNQFAQMVLKVDSGSGQDVSPVCPLLKDSTTCTYGSLHGIRKFSYSDTITLPFTSDVWTFIYTGRVTGNSQAGRSSNITNISNVGGQLIYLVSTLNNLNGPNNSPVFATIPTPYYCVNVNQQYNPGATDPDNDSLWFQMVPGLDNGSPVVYANPFTAQLPLSAPDFIFNGYTGQMSFTPDILQNALVVNKTSEYKNGIVVGSSMREMTFIVTPCQNIPPDGDLATNGSNISGGIHVGDNVINVCKKDGNLVKFQIDPDDQNQHDIKVTVINTPPGAQLTVTGDSSVHPVLNFQWNVTTVPPGVYTFYVNYKDDGCPLVTSKTIAYTIRIIEPFELAAVITNDTGCKHHAEVAITVQNGLTPRTVVVSQGGNVVKTYYDTSGVITDSLAPGTYTITVDNPQLDCNKTIDFTVPDSGFYPGIPLITDSFIYCLHTPAEPLQPVILNGAIVHWYDNSGTLLPGFPTINTDTPGHYTIFVSQQLTICESEKVKVEIFVNPKPEVELQMTPRDLCWGEKVYLRASGANKYMWEPEGLVRNDGGNGLYIKVLEPIQITVIGFDSTGCKDTATIKYTHVEECCDFWYPNAFSPNGDGVNDVFKPVTKGEMIHYDLYIYNRWGQVVYHTTNPALGWDGKFKGQPCDVGMYYYMVKAECTTGKDEFTAKAVDLLR